ncbi:hypothetical protein [Salibacterium sp. K-3]
MSVAETKSPTLHTTARRLQTKLQRAHVTDYEAAISAMTEQIDEEVEAFPETKRNDKGEQTSPFFIHNKRRALEVMGDTLDFVAENLEREAEREEIYHRTRAEWQAMEHEYTIRSTYTLPDLIDDLLKDYENDKIDAYQFKAIRREYQPCAHRFCITYFKPARKDQQFCCGDCSQKERDARKEYRRTEASPDYSAPTYLPREAYQSNRLATNDNKYKAKEIAMRMEDNTREYLTGLHKGGRVDRDRNEKRYRQPQLDEEEEASEGKHGGMSTFNMYELTYEELKEKSLIKSLQGASCGLKSREKIT